MRTKFFNALAITIGCLTFPCTSHAQNWYQKAIINAGVDLNGVHFTSDQTGFAVGTGGNIYYSSDGGATWSSQTSTTTQNLYDVFFVNSSTGFAVGANGTIRKTINGGSTWTTQTASGTGSTTFYEVQFLDANNGFMVGSGGKIIKTTDGGNTWSTLTSGTTVDLQGLHFTSTSVGYVAGPSGLIKKTINGGTSWSTLTVATIENFNDIFFVDANTGYAGGTNGAIWQTTNAGSTWISKNSGLGSLAVYSIYFPSATSGHASSAGDYIYVTIDGSNNWISYEIPPSNANLNDTYFSSVYTGYMVGDGGVVAKYQSEIDPQVQPSNLTFTEVYSSSMKVNFTASPDIPLGYFAVRKPGSLPTSDPVDGMTYTVGQTLGDGTVAYIGSATTFSESLLTAGTAYYYKIYAYNGTGQAINYKTDSPLSGNKQTYSSGTPWTSVISTGFFPQDVHFYDANNGSVAGTYFEYTTTSGGQSWTAGFSGNGDAYSGTFSPSQGTSYIVGSNSNLIVIRRTVNNGTSWVDQLRATSAYSLNDIWFATATTGVVVGSGGYILRTVNGLTWAAVASPTVNALNGINFSSTTNGIAVGTSGTILRTINSGSSWSTITSGTSATLNDVYFVDANTGYSVGSAGTIIKSIDGGATWSPLTSGTTLDLNGIHFADANTGYAVGLAGTILKTTDAGVTWYAFTSGTNSSTDFYGVNFPTASVGYAVGYQGTNAAIYKYESVPKPTSQPTALAYSSISATGVTLAWTPPLQTVDGYVVVRKIGSAPTSDPLDGNSYAAGTTLGDGTVAYAGSSPSFTETALTAGVNYFYKVYAYNSSGTGATTNYLVTSPLTGNTTTTLVAPVAASATSILTSGFTANWAVVSGATSYQLDVSADNFSTFVTGYNNLSVGPTTWVVTGLSSGIAYSYRVRAVNVSGASGQSNTISVITIPAAPASTAATNVSTSGLTSNWSAAVGATSYYFDLSANNFSSFVPGYNNLSVTATTLIITGLSAGTTYQYRVRAVNGSGTSINSGAVTTLTLCNAPTANGATALTESSFTANWSSATGAADYRIDVSTDPSFSFIVGTYNNLTVAGISISVTGLNAGTSYYYRVRASNASGVSANSNPISVLTLPTAPVAYDAGAVGSLTFNVSWSAVSSATGYSLDVSASNTFSSFLSGYNGLAIAFTSATITVPLEGLTYYYRVRATNATGSSVNSNVITTLLKPAAPVAALSTSATGTGFTANWGSASGATSYSLEVSSDNFVSNVAGYDNLGVSGTSAAVTNLNEGTTYKYRVRAINATWASALSNIVSTVTIPPSPVAINATSASTTGFTAKWNATPGAASYLLDVSSDNFSTFLSGFNASSQSGTSANITGLTAGNTYQYRLRAVNISGVSANSNIISTSTLSSAPVANAASALSSTGFTASWNTVVGATDYRADVSVSNTFASFEGIYNNLSTSVTSLAVTGLTAGTTYYYRIRANNSSGVSSNSNVVTLLVNPAAPVATAATLPSTTGFTANWNSVPGVSGYRLDVSVNDFISNLTGFNDLVVSGTSKVVTGLSSGTTYKFRVRSVNATGPSDNSNSIAVITVPPAPVATVATQVTTSGFTANWNTTSGIPAYYLDVSSDIAFGSFISGYNNFAASNGAQTITGLSNGTTYYYRVRATNISGTSANSNIISTVTLPIAPVANAATVITSSGFVANWSSVTGATGYRLDISTDNGFSFYVGSYFNQSVTGTSLVATGLTPGTFYYYRLRAENGSGTSVSSSTISVLTLPGAPVANTALSVTNTTFLANWSSVSSATGYFLDVSAIADFSTFVSGFNNLSTPSTSVTVTVPTAGLTYYYRVRAVSAAGMSANSNSVSTLLQPSAPNTNAATAVAADAFTASWSAVTGATGYYLDVSSDNFASFISPYNNFLLAGTTSTITSLNAGTSYQYRVRAYNATGSSSNSSAISLVTIPPAPVTTSSTSFTTTSFTAHWQSTSGATDYRLDVSSDYYFGIGSFVTGFNDLTVAGTSASVTGLAAGTVYYYRVRAVNAWGTSPNSNVANSTNIPSPPTGLFATGITTTSFTANWAVTSGALGYFLDVSTDNYNTFTTDYNSLSVSTNSSLVSGLTAGVTYQFRVRATNSSGTSINSLSSTIQTLPEEPTAQPTALSFNAITTSTLKAGFTSSAGGATGYIAVRASGTAPTSLPVDGISYMVGSALGDGTIAYFGNATTFSDSSLAPGNTYYYIIFAFNGSGSSTNYLTSSPLSGSQITVPDPPALSAASVTSQGGFTVNWVASTGATNYLIDLSTDNFGTFVAGFNGQPTGNVTSFVVTAVSGGTSFQYRLRAQNAAGTSANSPSQSALTIPDTPSGLASTSITATSFVVTWTAVKGIDNYLVDLSADSSFSVLTVNGASTTDTTLTFSGLANATNYNVRVRAADASGISSNSVTLKVKTLSGTGGPAALVIGSAIFTGGIKSAAVPVTVNITGGTDPKSVLFHYKKITANNFLQIAAAVKSGNTYESDIQVDMADELGVEFYFTATDADGQTDESDAHSFIYRAIDASSNQSIPFVGAAFDGKAASYQMFSIPYDLADQTISNLFEPVLNGFSNTRWRLLHFVNGTYADYPGQLKKIDLGEGYWFNTIQKDFQIKLGVASVNQATPQSPFIMTLEKGWNQIGDPYPFDIDWNILKAANPDAGLNSIWMFANGGFAKEDVLPVWNGAFVFSENGGAVTFPLAAKTNSSGRVATKTYFDHASGEWQLPMIIEAGSYRASFSVGMHDGAISGKDQFDEVAVPRFLDYVEMTTFHPEYFAHRFSSDVVAPSSAQNWEFTLNTNLDAEKTIITWDKEALNELSFNFLLLDEDRRVLVNMKTDRSYAFDALDGQHLKVIVNEKGNVKAGTTALENAYPNPFSSSLHVPVYVEETNTLVSVQVYNMMGQMVKSLENAYAEPGYYELEWDGKSSDPSTPSQGLLLYRVSMNGASAGLKRIIKLN